MSQRKQRNRMPPSEVAKVRAYYQKKYEEFKEKTVEELVEISKTTKMSFTAKRALVHAFNEKKPVVTSETTEAHGSDEE